MWLRTPQKATDAWLCALSKLPNHSKSIAAGAFRNLNTPILAHLGFWWAK
jgi:hypothetical protein